MSEKIKVKKGEIMKRYTKEQYETLACRYIDCKLSCDTLLLNYENDNEKLIKFIDRVVTYTKKVGYKTMENRLQYFSVKYGKWC